MCLASLLETRNKWSIVDHPEYKAYMQLKQQAEPVPNTERVNASPIYRISDVSDKEHEENTRDFYHGDTISCQIYKICKERSDKTAILYRVLKNTEITYTTDSNGKEKKMETYVFEPESYKISYTQIWNNITNLSKGFLDIGLCKGEKVAIYEDTRWEWFCSVQAIWHTHMVAVTVYANLGEDALLYAFKETNCKAIICNGKSVSKIISFMNNNYIQKTVLIYIDKLPNNTNTKGYTVYSLNDLLKKGGESSVSVINFPTSENCDDTALIMYTSGTTGNPKGVTHTHGSLISGLTALNYRVIDVLGKPGIQETYCAYLPLAHIMELTVVNIFFLRGCLICFGSPRTLTSTFAKPHGDLEEFRPVLFVGVPRIFDTIKRGVEAKLPPPGSLRRIVFNRAYEARLKALKEGKDTPYFNSKVFSQISQAMGGRVRVMLSGGGPLNPATQEFVNVVFGLIIQGWGLTETVSCGGVQLTGNLDYNNVGRLLRTEELQLLDTGEYKHTDKPQPRGEILLRGPFLFKGYYKQDELTKEVIDKDGWFHTGDVGSVNSNGTVSIIGRVKALAKNSNGEYIAMEALEATYGACNVITPNGVCVVVHPSRSYIVALGTTTEQLAMDFAKKKKISGTYPAILDSPQFCKEVTRSFQETARSSGRQSFEVVRHVRLLNEEWTPENDVLTAAMKLKRRVIEKRYKDIIDEMFAEEL